LSADSFGVFAAVFAAVFFVAIRPSFQEVCGGVYPLDTQASGTD
jgi:hypothetical protein